MRQQLYGDYGILSLFLVLFSIFLILRGHYTKKIYPPRVNVMRILFLISIFIISLFNACVIAYQTTNMAVCRKRGMDELQKMAEAQREYFYKNGHYAKSFKELGYGTENLGYPSTFKKLGYRDEKLGYSYAFYLNEDILSAGPERVFPEYLKSDPNHIYAVSYSYNNSRDVLAVDYCGKIEIIESFNKWPLPEP